MKAILRLEMPTCCNLCRLYDHEDDFCYGLEEAMYNQLTYQERAPNCPLEPVREPEVEIKMKNYSSGRYAEEGQ
jgi:hypothetical protein